jgi:hypothetical protein
MLVQVVAGLLNVNSYSRGEAPLAARPAKGFPSGHVKCLETAVYRRNSRFLNRTEKQRCCDDRLQNIARDNHSPTWRLFLLLLDK